MQMEGIIAKGQLVPLLFMHEAIAAGQTDAQLKIAELADPSTGEATTAIDEYVMPFDGAIVAISAELSAAASAGSLTIGPTVDGTEKTDLQVSVTTETEKYKVVPREKIRFRAGDRIGCEITTDGSWNGTTADLGVVVWVLLHLESI